MSDAGRVYGRGISFPVRLGPDGRVASSAGPDNIREAIRLILLTEPGERVQLPTFGGGARAFLFEPNTVATRRLIQERIEDALRGWEPRIRVEALSVEEDPEDPRAAIATVRYQLVADRSSEQVSVSVQLAS
ncbi:MAG TPA: GPW/gp25 family protein [Longimicrobiales bacterium]|nr:GPW/gp25 family protein [Longimicrobiales bacterium]